MNRERIDRLRTKMQNRKATLCPQRALFYTKVFQENEQDPYILKKAKAFAYTLNHMDLYVEEDGLIFGNQASRNFAAPIFPEYSIDWVIKELDEFESRDGDVFYVDENTKAALRSIQPYWSGHTHEDEVNANLTDEIRQAEKQGVIHRGGISMSGDGHIVPDHEMILRYGLDHLIEEARNKRNESNLYYEAVIIALEGVLNYTKRFALLLKEKAAKEVDPIRKGEYEQMAQIAQKVFHGPAENFYEGVEAVYLIHVLQMIESNGHSFCYGRFDQYLYDLYQQDIDKKRLDQDRALELITHMFIMNSSCNKVRPYGHTKFSQGYPLYSNLVVGGLKPDGSDGTNELSYLCIEAMGACRLAEPNFSARYHAASKKDYLQACTRLIKTGCGMPSMFNDQTAIKGLFDLGIPIEDARDYCPIGCVETGVPGKYGHRATGMTYVNWGKVFEIMLYNGYDPRTGISLIQYDPESSERISRFLSYEDLWQTWKKFLKYYSDLAVECDHICDKALRIYDADPLASCLIQDSMKLGKLLKEGGCRYDVISQSNIGPSVVGNSLYSMKKLVFEKGLAIEELLGALQDDFQSIESRRILKQIRQLPKFGNDEDEVDQIVKDVFDSYLELLPTYKTERDGQGPRLSLYTMSTSNITSYVPNGFVVGATPDGRHSGTPLNEGCSPTQGTDRKGPTALIASVAKLPNDKVAAGQLLNMRFSPSSLSGSENEERFVDFLRVSAKKGIYHNQFNVIDSSVLKDAIHHPDQYSDLIVRVAGYCAQFTSLMPQAQEAIIARTQNEWN